ncbi:5'/3'-nucleotidase SurE [Saccharothrix variisporea]|uniref:5'-nucleotidase n=1 Tax=Saccharothrix variisporea TaxID=543527 RepID=A0A495XAM7_9PSEU|nr:5'/3'-nucleotidase SurE [Saccharothrix variisporea]RKT68578.1 5'-nucleotidase [Saccharothrix variisporea]
MDVLITNDDGIDSPGLAALARAAVAHGWRVVVAAPAQEASGTGAGLTATEEERDTTEGKRGAEDGRGADDGRGAEDGRGVEDGRGADDGRGVEDGPRVAVRKRSLPGLDGVPAYAVSAHPGLIALVASQGAFGDPPRIVLSGVNRGANVGRAVLHSGTVGAALTAALNGARAMAVSLDVDLDPRTEPHWDTAVAVAAGLFDRLAALPPGTTLNLNVPDRPHAGPPRRADLAEFGLVRSRVQESDDGSIHLAAVVVEGDLPPGSDAALLAEGHATLTPLRSIVEDPGVQL